MKGLNEVVGLLKKGEVLYGGRVSVSQYGGDLVWGQTEYLVITPDSTPLFHLSFQENVEIGAVKEITPLFERKVILSTREIPAAEEALVYVISTQPCRIWRKHRGYTGSRVDDEDSLHVCEEIRDVVQLKEFLKSLEESPSLS